MKSATVRGFTLQNRLQHRWIATAETVLVIVDEHADQSLWQPRRRVGALGKILALQRASSSPAHHLGDLDPIFTPAASSNVP
jgi:hypothetical protein